MHASAHRRRIAAAGLAVAGLVGGHAITYALVVPRGGHGHATLLDAAHGYLPAAAWAAALLGSAALLAGIGAGYASRLTKAGWWTTARALVVAQTAAFCTLEALERLAVGASLADLAGPLIIVGIVVQIVLAICAALVLRGLHTVGAALSPPRAPRAERGLAARIVPPDACLPRVRFSTPIAGRAPPAAAA